MPQKMSPNIGFVAKEKSKLITDYVNNLTKKYQRLVEVDLLENSSGKIEDIFAKFKNLNQYPDLNKASLNYFIHLLQLKDKSAWDTEVEISMKALIQAWLYSSYYFLQTLAETIDRKEAVKLFKRYITCYFIDHPSPDRDKFVSLKKRLENQLSGDTTASEWVIVHALVEEGKHTFKNKNCPTCASLEPAAFHTQLSIVLYPNERFQDFFDNPEEGAKFIKRDWSGSYDSELNRIGIRLHPKCTLMIFDKLIIHEIIHAIITEIESKMVSKQFENIAEDFLKASKTCGEPFKNW